MIFLTHKDINEPEEAVPTARVFLDITTMLTARRNNSLSSLFSCRWQRHLVLFLLL